MAKVFISSTSIDLQEYRLAAIEICNRLGLTPVAMEFFESMGKGATEGSKHKLATADVYVGIFAHRLGYIEEGYDKAVTEVEFELAREAGIDRLCFLADPSYPWPPESIDYKNYDRLQGFKKSLDAAVIRSLFTTVDDFRAKLMHSLVEWKSSQSLDLPSHSQQQQTIAEHSHLKPPPPSLIVGRDKDLSRLLARLNAPNGLKQPFTVVRGWPGVGKTTLVSALAHHPTVANAFKGVLWASLGDRPDLIAELNSWLRYLTGQNIEKPTTLQSAVMQVRALAQGEKILAIVDDVWSTDAGAAFKAAAADCPIIFTTRFPSVARELAPSPNDIQILSQLSEQESHDLLQQLAPTITKDYPEEVNELARRLEGLPLALRVAGRLLEAEALLGWSIGELLTDLAEGTALLTSTAPDDHWDPDTGTVPTVSLLLKKSTDRLDEETRERFAYLGAFAPKPATFDLDAMQEVWQVADARPTARILADRGILEPIVGTGRFQMHAILVLHARSLLNR